MRYERARLAMNMDRKDNDGDALSSRSTQTSASTRELSLSPRHSEPLLGRRLSSHRLEPFWIAILLSVVALFVAVSTMIGISLQMSSLPPPQHALEAVVSSFGYKGASGFSSNEFRLSAYDQVKQWVDTLFSSELVDVKVRSKPGAHASLVLRGTLVPRSTDPLQFDGEFAYKVDEQEHHNAALVRGKGFEWVTSGNFGQKLERTGCLSRNQVPPLHLLTRHLRMATLESDGSIKVQFAGEIYRIRREDGPSSRPTKVIVESDDVLIELSPTSLALRQPLPDFVDQIPDLPMCPVLFESLADDSAVSLSEQLAVDENVTSATSCTCEATRNCLFIHGIGVHDDRGLIDAYPEYWGDIQRSMPCCSVVKFTHLNTVDSAWFSGLFAQRLCDALTATAMNGTFVLTNDKKPKKNSQQTPLKNLIVVAHSTGNLHLASAFLHNECSLDSATSKWIAIQGPMRGTNTANRVVEECNKPASTWDKLVQTVVRDFELCPVKNSTKSLVLKNTPVSPGCLNTLYDKATRVYNERVNASLCGVSPFGLTSTSSPKFVALAAFSNHSTSENDGVVAFESCLSSARDYQTTYRSAFYKASINHDDGRLIHGDGVWGEDRKPIKWLQCQT